MKFFISILVAGVVSSLFAAQYQIVPQGASFQIFRDGKLIVEKVESPLTATKNCTFRVEQKEMKDGSKVWNFISTDKRINYRMEAALLNNGSCVEITSAITRPAKDPARISGPMMAFELHKDFIQDAEYEVLPKGCYSAQKTQKGVLSKFPSGNYWRWLGLKNKDASVIFDVNPFGPSYSHYATWSHSCCGVALMKLKKDSFRIQWPLAVDSSFGGYFAGKIRIKDGSYADFTKDHAFTTFHYTRPITRQYLFSFGSKKHGAFYTTADGKSFDSKRNWGWLSGKPEKTVTTGAGAYYSHQLGKDSTFRFTGLPDGLHLVTFGAGNPTGTDNKFSVSVNGQKLLENVTIAKDRFLTATLPLWIDNGICDVKITGNYIVSAIGNQFLLSNREDFTCRRGFWVSDSYEPSALHNNNNSKPYALVFKPSVKESVLPPHGKELSAPYRRFRVKTSPRPNLQSPEYSWLFNINLGRVGNNVASFEEMKDPKVMEAVLDDEVKKGKNAIMFTGLLSHHTFPKSEERILSYTKRFNEMAHKRGLKVIHHYDVTLLWNCEAGFRVLAETLDGVNRSLDSQLPGNQYCILSPYFQKSCYDHSRKLVEAGSDGLQMDEFTFVRHSCSCPNCREEFHKDTGWYLPVDETHPGYHNIRHPLNRALIEWKMAKTGEIRAHHGKEMKRLNPYLIFSGYGAFFLSTSPSGFWEWMSDKTRHSTNTSLMGKESQCCNAIANARMYICSQKFYNYYRYNFGTPIYTWCGTWDWKNSYFAFFACLMNGQSPLDYGGGFSDKSKGHMEFEPFASNPDAMNRQVCREMPKLGLLYSYQTVCNADELFPRATYGFTQTLEELHIPYVFLSDWTMEEKYLIDFKVLFAGSASCLDDSEIDAIKKFAEKGGTVIMNTLVGTRNTVGKMRKVWPFEKIMGFKPSAKMVEVQSVSDGKTTVSPSFAKLKAVNLIPAQQTKSLFSVKLKNGKTLPGLIEKPFGKGKFLYSPVRMEELFNVPIVGYDRINQFEFDVPMAEFYRAILRKIIGDTSLLKTDAPEKVFMTLYRENDQVLIHLLNGTASGMKKGEKGRGKFKGDPFPALTKDITITAPCFGKNEVFAVSPDFKGRKKLAAKYNADGTVTVTLPRELLKGYTLIRIR